MRGKTFGLTATILLAATAVGLTGCADGEPNDGQIARGRSAAPFVLPAAAEAALPDQDPRGIQFKLDQTKLPLRQWRSDGSHLTTVKGSLLYDGQPVAGAILHSGSSLYNIATDADGSFRWVLDQSQLAVADVRVHSLEQASIGGQPIRQEQAEQLKKAIAPLSVYYPIRITKVLASSGNAGEVEVHARIVSAKEDTISFFQADKYRISGIVKDAGGRPVQNATVWIDRDNGEGFGKSTPTDAKGEYQIFYLPDQEEGTNLAVVVGATRYVLPKNKVLHIPEDTSVKINITLPKEGTVLGDQPPELTCEESPGTMYTGVLAGLDVAPDVHYSVTIPDDEGNFTVKVAKEVWGRHPAFFEIKLSKFVEGRRLKAGDSLPSGLMVPGAYDPKDIAPDSELTVE